MIDRRQILGGLAASTVTLGFSAADASAAPSRFTIKDDDFLLDGKPVHLMAGEMHYPRIPRELWRDRLRKLKALGLNTLSTYTFWSAHEKRPGVYDFSGNLDVAAWVKMAQEEGLHVLLRPGPYACAEWDNGGYPAWFLNDPDIRPRSLDPRYMGPAGQWLKRLGQEVAHLEIDKGGPILMTQVENEYGSYGNDLNYMRAVRDQVRAAGFSGQLYTVDGAAVIENGALPELFNGINFGTYDKAEGEFARYARFKTKGPRMCTELWGGWFDHFGEMHSNMEIPPLMESLKWMLDNRISFSFYMLHGGTSFAFDAGANFHKTHGYQPDISSYDYDAMLDEAGRVTPKYEAARELFRRYLPPERFTALPEPEKALKIERFTLRETAPLSQLYPKGVSHAQPKTFEQMGQNHGLMLYRHAAKTALSGQLRVGEARDYALVSAGQARFGTLDRRLKETEIEVSLKAGDTLDLLIDAMGHVNYGDQIGKDQKGLIGPVTLNGKPLTGWTHLGVSLDDLSALRFKRQRVDGPAFYRGTFETTEAGFTFLDLRGWGKGYVWVNGHNLGRYWSVGPQRAVFVPAPYLKVGVNEVVVLDLHDQGERSLAGSGSQIWDLPGLVKG
ncbi:MAG: beta-galactosidase [Asticcacaulis sp.]|uniref:glycoside hydrolase family 35 protein n=1 Tax=Asticcacaulis sp. TaxID=1872648 RepID=UPI0025BC2D7D|nr:beta-galactosidase [Asticcacaulis sp.]MCA1933896.1 beta-galactosidase [Asticcacaulis sp.]